jgi:hypothetical protein
MLHSRDFDRRQFFENDQSYIYPFGINCHLVLFNWQLSGSRKVLGMVSPQTGCLVLESLGNPVFYALIMRTACVFEKGSLLSG